MKKLLALLAGVLALCAPARAQDTGNSVIFPSGYAPGQAPCVKQADKTCVPVSATNPLPVTLPQLTATAGLAIAFGTTAATLFNANPSRHFIVVQVQGSTGGCYINGTGAATADANSLYIPAGGYFESSTHVGTGAVSIICTAAATPVYSRQG